jgi:arsenite-transporting ATPase
VLFDTAPTGHTIRLLQLPGSWTDFLNEGKGDASCLGPLAGLDKQRTVYADAVAALKDPARTRLVLVTRAQASALAEVDRTNDELAQIGIHATHLIVNGVLPATAGEEDLATAVRTREATAVAQMPERLAGMQVDVIELKAANMIGLPALRLLLDDSAAVSDGQVEEPAHFDGSGHRLSALVDQIEQDGHGLVMCMGKGGVGKTTIAAAIAVALARRGHQVHLTTTDPAAHVEETLHGAIDGLQVSRIDPVEATREYRERIMSTKGKNLDAAGRAALHEDLLSPCTEEVAVFGQFSHVVNSARHEFVVVDTAPTGHTLLLLDAAGSYHRDIVRQMGEGAKFRTPMMMLQDPELTKVILVTLPEPTPVTEARVLQDDLQRAGIHPWAWVVNNSLAAAQPTSAFLRHRAAAEALQVEVVESLSNRVAIVPLLSYEPVGEAALASVASSHVAVA